MSMKDLERQLSDIVNEGVFSEREKEKVTAPYRTDERIAQIYGITVAEVEMIRERVREYSLSKSSQSYKDWCLMYDGFGHRESTFEHTLRDWLACYRQFKNQPPKDRDDERSVATEDDQGGEAGKQNT